MASAPEYLIAVILAYSAFHNPPFSKGGCGGICYRLVTKTLKPI
jgi:hypothetical protein